MGTARASDYDRCEHLRAHTRAQVLQCTECATEAVCAPSKFGSVYAGRDAVNFCIIGEIRSSTTHLTVGGANEFAKRYPS